MTNPKKEELEKALENASISAFMNAFKDHAMAICCPNGDIISANESFSEMSLWAKRDPAVTQDNNLYEIFNLEDLKKQQLIDKVANTNEPETYNFEFLINKSFHLYKLSLYPFLTDHDHPVVIALIKNNTEFRIAKHFSSIVDQTEDYATIKDLNLKIIAANKSLMAASGLSDMTDMVGKNDLELYGETEIVRKYIEDELKAQKLKPGDYIEHEEDFIKHDGSVVRTLVKKFPIYDENGILTGTANISRNIGELKKIEQQLKELNATKDMFFNIIAHDLKNPFGSIMGFSQMILRKAGNADPSKVLLWANYINKASKHGYELLENLLQWSRSQSGNMKVNTDKVLLDEIIELNFDVLNEVATHKNITFKKYGQTNLCVEADEDMINTVLRNLLSNAIKFSEKNSQISVFTRVNLQNAIIEVIDKGIGIHPEDLNKLFRIDENFSTEGTNNEQGTGLGLILCKEFVTKNKGEIWVESKLGEGTKFLFSLPLLTEQ